jgi:membrane protease YdiL (CAAX protease family)
MSTPPAPPQHFSSHPELPEGVEPRRWPRWPPWASVAAFVAGAAATLVGASIIGAIAVLAFDAKATSPGVTIVGSVVQDMCLIAAALIFARMADRPVPAQFGLRPTGVRRALGWMLATWVAFFVFTGAGVALWGALTGDQPQNDEALEGLGVDRSTAAMLGAAFLVSVVAPIGEEFFFRGFFYGALRTRFPFLAAALLDGIVFGAVHAPTGIEAVPPLIVLGFAFCVAYEATGSILPGIVLHALNNMVAFGADKDGSWAVAGATAGVVLVAAITLPGRSRTLN